MRWLAGLMVLLAMGAGFAGALLTDDESTLPRGPTAASVAASVRKKWKADSARCRPARQSGYFDCAVYYGGRPGARTAQSYWYDVTVDGSP
jgi:hypothetical protein